MNNYNYDGFSTKEYNLDSFHGPELGSKAPDFEIPQVGGEKTRLLDFSGEFLVLETGSITCPLFQGRRAGMERLVKKFPDVSFSVLYVREAHPGKKIPSHKTIEGKEKCALRLKETGGERRNILLDGLDGKVHTAYGNYPNAIFVINKNGCVVFKSDWNNPKSTEKALSQLLNGKPAQSKSFFLPVNPLVAIKTLSESGWDAFLDFLVGLPKLIWKNLLRRNLLLLLNKELPIEPNTSC